MGAQPSSAPLPPCRTSTCCACQPSSRTALPLPSTADKKSCSKKGLTSAPPVAHASHSSRPTCSIPLAMEMVSCSGCGVDGAGGSTGCSGAAGGLLCSATAVLTLLPSALLRARQNFAACEGPAAAGRATACAAGSSSHWRDARGTAFSLNFVFHTTGAPAGLPSRSAHLLALPPRAPAAGARCVVPEACPSTRCDQSSRP